MRLGSLTKAALFFVLLFSLPRTLFDVDRDWYWPWVRYGVRWPLTIALLALLILYVISRVTDRRTADRPNHRASDAS